MKARRQTRTALSMIAALVLCRLAGATRGAPPMIPVDDLNDWHAEFYCGAPGVTEFVQGPRLEGGLGGTCAFDSRGTAYTACGTFIQEMRGETVRVLAGAPGVGGTSDGAPWQATFGMAVDIALDGDDRMYVVDAANLTLRRLEKRTDGLWHTATVAGTPGMSGHRDGTGRQALFTSPFESVAVVKGVVYLLDGNWLRKFENGIVTTLNAGTGYVNGPVHQARFNRSQVFQSGLTYDGRGALYIADKVNYAIRKLDLSSMTVSTVAGMLPGGKGGGTRDGRALEAQFNAAGGPCMAFYNRAYDYLLVKSDDEGVVRRVADGWVKSFGGTTGKEDLQAGPWRDCRGGLLSGVDGQGNVYVCGGKGYSSGQMYGIRVVKKGAAPQPAPATRSADQAERAAPRPEPFGRLAKINPTGDYETMTAVATRLVMGAAHEIPLSTDYGQRRPAVACGNGVYLLAWDEGYTVLGGRSMILAVRLDVNGKPLDASPIRVCDGGQVCDSPRVAYGNGRFLVVWQDARDGADYDVYGAWVDRAGRASPENGFRIAGGPGGQARPAVAADANGRFCVVWQDFGQGTAPRLSATRIEPGAEKVVDQPALQVAERGEAPAITSANGAFFVSHGRSVIRVGGDGAVGRPAPIFPDQPMLAPSTTTAWGAPHVFLNVVPSPDPWGWSGTGLAMGVRVGPDGAALAADRYGGSRQTAEGACDGQVRNCLDVAQWRNHTGWPCGMPGGFKNTHDGMWPSGPPAAMHNGRTLTVVWPSAHVVDDRRVRNRDLYLRRSYEDWGWVDAHKVPLVAGPNEETNPVLAGDGQGHMLLAYEQVDESRGVTVVHRVLREEEDAAPPRVAWVGPLAETQMVVAFDEPIDPRSAENAGAFAIDGLRVRKATFNTDAAAFQREVLLETDPQVRGDSYTMRVTGVKDRSSRRNSADGTPVKYLCKPGALERSPFVSQWAIAGPFPNNWSVDYADSALARPSPGDPVKPLTADAVRQALREVVSAADWEAVGWNELGPKQFIREGAWKKASCEAGCVLNLDEAYGRLAMASAYASAYVFSETPREVLVRADSNDGNQVWLNGRLIGSDPTAAGASRGFHDYTNEYPACLAAGWNRLLVRVGNTQGAWKLALQVTDENRIPVSGPTWQLDRPHEP